MMIQLGGVTQFPIENVIITTAAEIMKECGADGWVGRYEEELAKL